MISFGEACQHPKTLSKIRHVKARRLHLAAIFLLSLPLLVTGFQYQHDSRDDCAEHVSECQSSPSLWYECPVTCAESLEWEGNMAEVKRDPEAFYELTVTTASGKPLSLEDFEGYVTIYATVPLEYYGMASFYYEMLEHIAGVFPYTVQFLLLPLSPEGGITDSTNWLLEKQKERKSPPKVVMLAPSRRPTEELEYLSTVSLMAGNPDRTLPFDRASLFIVSADGKFVERLISPNISTLERRISVYLQQLAMEPEF